MTGYRVAVYALEQEDKLADKVVEIVGDAQSATYIFANGGSQVQDPDTKELLLLETLLDIVKNFEVRLRWGRQLAEATDAHGAPGPTSRPSVKQRRSRP